MSSNFNIQYLIGDGALVSGTDINGDEGSVVLNAKQYHELHRLSSYNGALKEFNEKVEEFYAPLTEAAEAAQEALKDNSEDDELLWHIVSEGTEGVEAKPAERIRRTDATIILMLIETGKTDRLLWVNDGHAQKLVIARA